MSKNTRNIFDDFLTKNSKEKHCTPSPKLCFIATEIYGMKIDGLDIDGILKRIRQAEIRYNRRI